MDSISTQLEQVRKQLTATGAPFELIDIEENHVRYKAYKQAPCIIPELIAGARLAGDKTFLVYEGERYSFTQFFQHVDRLSARLLKDFNIKKGDRVAISMRNYPEWMTSFIAIISVGAIAVPINSWGKATELEHAIRDADVQLIFCDQPRFDLLQPTLDKENISAVLVRSDLKSVPVNTQLYDVLVKTNEDHPLPQVAISPEDPALILYTSGTTGTPKGALSTHRSICQAIFNFNFAAACAAMTSPGVVQAMQTAGYEPASLLALPLFHVSGCHAVLLLNLHTARKIVILHKWDVEKALKTIENERITTFSGVPTMTCQLLDSQLFDHTDTSSLFGIGGGGSASPPQLVELIKEKLPNAFAGTGYGLTETNAAGTSSTGSAYQYKPSSTGTLSPIVELEIRDNDGNSLAPGKTGQVWLKGISLLQSYWRNPQATADAIRQGWFDTGDIGYLDEEGFLFLVDRAKDMIIRGGENIYAAEIEACIYKHPSVQDVAAFGVPHESLGEVPAVALELKAETTATEQEICDHVALHLANFKVPAYVWFCPAPLPRNASGKLMKKQIREDFFKAKG